MNWRDLFWVKLRSAVQAAELAIERKIARGKPWGYPATVYQVMADGEVQCEFVSNTGDRTPGMVFKKVSLGEAIRIGLRPGE